MPIIIIGDIACGKILLITKLNKILNDGKTNLKYLIYIPEITDEIIIFERMEKANKETEDLKNEGKELWLFFDEMSTCLSLSFLIGIFIHKIYNGIKLSDNIRLIGAYNPFRKRKGNKEKF